MQFGFGVNDDSGSEAEAMLRGLAADPLAEADKLDALANELHARAALIREAVQTPAHGYRSTGGMGDRARLRVVGPDGTTRRETDTGAN